jgi:5-oxoprolinase (ATP-hydrolysing) subunit A
MSAKDAALANCTAKAVKDFDASLILFGLSGSHSISEAKAIGLATTSEVFADRTYRDDGSLTPRSQPNALIEDADKAVQQVLQMIKEGTVTTVSGKTIPIVAETICIHGDGKHAAEFAKAIHDAIK